MSVESGIVMVDKPAGVTSHQVVRRLRQPLDTRRIEHVGALDPMATGMLIPGVNRAARLLGHLALHDGRYLATVCLGQGSITDDANGKVVAVAGASGITLGGPEPALASLRGRIQQAPSAASAIKVDGKHIYNLARRGIGVELKAREAEMTHLNTLASHPGGGTLGAGIDVERSSGIYARVIARGLGKSLEVGRRLTVLQRTWIGSYNLSVAVELGEDPPTMMPMTNTVKHSFPRVAVDLGRATDVGFERRLDMTVPVDVTGTLSPTDELLALYRPGGDGAKPAAVLV